MALKVRAIQKQLSEADDKAKLYNSRESLFDKDITDYSSMQDMQKAFEPFFDTWEGVDKWMKWEKEWMNGPFVNLDADYIEQGVAQVFRALAKSTKYFERNQLQGCLVIAQRIKSKVDEFKPFVPVITALRNPGMRDRHWGELSAAVGHKIDPHDPTFTLTKVIEDGLHTHMTAISKVAEKAGKEYTIETTLVKMQEAWKGMPLIVESYRETGTCIVKGVDEIMALCDEQITMVQAMQFSAFKGEFKLSLMVPPIHAVTQPFHL